MTGAPGRSASRPIDLRPFRLVAGTVSGAYAGLLLVHLIAVVVAGLDPGLWLTVIYLAFVVLGAACGLAEAREQTPWTLAEARKAVAVWGFLLTVAAIAPWLLLESWAGRVAGATATAAVGFVVTIRARRLVSARGVAGEAPGDAPIG